MGRRRRSRALVDQQALAALDALESALAAPVKAAAEAAVFQQADKKGRRPDWPARMVALRTHEAWRELIGEEPAISERRPYTATAFGRSLRLIFRTLDIDRSPRTVEWLRKEVRRRENP